MADALDAEPRPPGGERGARADFYTLTPRAAAGCSAGSEPFPGTGQSCSRQGCRWWCWGWAAPAPVLAGSPLRSIAPCAACHGPLGRKEGAPPLLGQKTAYLQAQLDAFAMGARHNDINQQMREVARALSASERAALAAWYGGARRPD